MATELEQFVEANKTRLAEVNASNPPLYSAISLALDYLNKNYFGGTSEIKVELPSVAPQITETPSIQVAFELRLFTLQEMKDLIQKNGWDNDTFKMTKIKVANDIESENFQRLAFLLGSFWVGSEKYDIKKKKKVYFVEDDGQLAFNTSDDTFESYSEYTTIEYDVIFADLLPQSKTTQTNDRIFTDSELEKLIFDNVYTLVDFKEIKIELKTDVQKKNFLYFIRKLVVGKATYNGFLSDGNYFYSDEDLVIFNDNKEKDFNESPYQKLFYNQIFEDLLKTQGKTTEVTPTFWDKAFCSKDWATKIDYNYLIKALKSNRRSKDMKVEIARAFGEICYLMENTKEYLEAKDYYANWSDTIYLYRYQFDPKVKEIFLKNGFDENDVINFSDLSPIDWTMSLVFPMFEQPLKIDPIVDELIEYYNEKIGQPVTEQTALTRETPITQPSTSNFKFNVGDEVKIVSTGKYFRYAEKAFKELNFKNTTENAFIGIDGDLAIVEATYVHNTANRGKVNSYKIKMLTGRSKDEEFLFDEEGLALVQAQTPQIEVGDWVEIVDVNLLVGVPINSVGRVSQFDADGDPFIQWVDIVGEDGYFKLDRFELVKKESDALFKIGDLIKTKDDYGFSDVKKGAFAVVTGLNINNSRIQVKFDWIDTPANKKLVGNNKMSDEWYEGYFELALSNEKQEEIARNVVDKLKTQSTSPVGFVKPDDTTQNNNEEDFEDLANQLEDLDF